MSVCKFSNPRIKNLVGVRFGRLLVSSLSHCAPSEGAWWKCVCDCGKEVVKRAKDIRFGKIKSCGCLLRETSSANGKLRKTHGFSKTKLYDVQRQMLRRCYNQSCKDYKRYGGRGITVCEEWKDIGKFIEWAKSSGYKAGLTIERIDSDGNYDPKNCSWIPNELQALNTSRLRNLTLNGETRYASDWARILGISVRTIIQRKNSGWSDEKALTTIPVFGRNQYK